MKCRLSPVATLLAALAEHAWLPARAQLHLHPPIPFQGLAEGVPRSMVPDQNGRADYFGASINQAVGTMQVAAHGGQVVCDEALAKGVFR